MGLSGASGAMQVWSDLFASAGAVTQQLAKPDAIEWYRVDRASAGLADKGCKDTVQLPFIESEAKPATAPCAQGRPLRWLPEWLQ
jgi:penicillin-binding protein 1B